MEECGNNPIDGGSWENHHVYWGVTPTNMTGASSQEFSLLNPNPIWNWGI